MNDETLCQKCRDAINSAPGWEEDDEEEEDPPYCTWDPCPGTYLGNEGVTHWMPLPEVPND